MTAFVRLPVNDEYVGYACRRPEADIASDKISEEYGNCYLRGTGGDSYTVAEYHQGAGNKKQMSD